MRRQLIASAALVLVPLAAASSQTLQDARAFVALRTTHIGALTPLLGPAMVGRQLNGAQLGIRYGLMREDVFAGTVTTHALAGSGIFPLGMTATWAIHAGLTDADCDGCAPELMLGLGSEMRILEFGDFMSPGGSLVVGVSGDAGYAKLETVDGSRSAFSLGVGAPVALTMSGGGTSGLRIVPYVTPVLGIGQISDCGGGGSCNGARFVLGGGVGFWNPTSNISASLGLNHVFFPDQDPVYGVNVTFGGR